jgi:hypothetical protein
MFNIVSKTQKSKTSIWTKYVLGNRNFGFKCLLGHKKQTQANKNNIELFEMFLKKFQNFQKKLFPNTKLTQNAIVWQSGYDLVDTI